MVSKQKQLPTYYIQALEASISASEKIMEIYQGEFDSQQKDDGSPVTIADLASSKIILAELKKTNIPIVGEESEKEPFDIRSKWGENWCVDPLDGTRMFLKRNDEFSVNIAHIVQHEAQFGIIADPVNQEILFGGPNYGAFISAFSKIHTPTEWEVLTPQKQHSNPPIVTCSHYFSGHSAPDYMNKLHDEFGELNYIRKGSALKFFDLCRGNADLYLRFAPTMEWDIAAGHAILRALGGEIIALPSFQPLTYNKESLYNPHFIAQSKGMLQ